jgi:hypothetical protein
VLGSGDARPDYREWRRATSAHSASNACRQARVNDCLSAVVARIHCSFAPASVLSHASLVSRVIGLSSGLSFIA